MRPPRQPLHTASDCNQSHLVGPLTSPREAGGCGADVNALLAGDTTPVYLAAQVRVRLTGDGGWWTPSSPRPLSEQRGFSAVVEALVAAGADLDFAMVRRGEQALLEGGSASSCAWHKLPPPLQPAAPFAGAVVDPKVSGKVVINFRVVATICRPNPPHRLDPTASHMPQ